MRRIKLTIAYDGTNYVGWQIQKNGLAVEQVINECLSELMHEDIVIIGASRTDSGVHAEGNVAVFDTNTKIPPEKIFLALNQRLPDDIKVLRSEEVDSDFHPRHRDCTKTYEYTFWNARYPDPVKRLYSAYIYYELDTEKMRKAAEYLTGEHDFTAFSTAGGQQLTSVRTINWIKITEEYSDTLSGQEQKNFAGADDPNSQRDFPPKLVRVTVNGNGFLYNMVRIIAGTLQKVGMGVYPPEYVKDILESCDRSLSAPKAPACGLKLLEINY